MTEVLIRYVSWVVIAYAVIFGLYYFGLVPLTTPLGTAIASILPALMAGLGYGQQHASAPEASFSLQAAINFVLVQIIIAATLLVVVAMFDLRTMAQLRNLPVEVLVVGGITVLLTLFVTLYFVFSRAASFGASSSSKRLR